MNDYKNCKCDGCINYRKENGIPEPASEYELNVKRIAEKLFLCEMPSFVSEMRGTAIYDRFFPRFMKIASMVVEEMAIEYRAAWNAIYDFNSDPEFGPIIEKEMKERGLIP